MNDRLQQRRRFIKSTAFGLIGITALGNASANGAINKTERAIMPIPFFTGIPV